MDGAAIVMLVSKKEDKTSPARRIREGLGLSREDVVRRAAVAGSRISVPTIKAIEGGHRAKLETLQIYAAALGVPVTDLLSDRLTPGTRVR